MSANEAAGLIVTIVGLVICCPLKVRQAIGLGLYATGWMHLWPFFKGLLT